MTDTPTPDLSDPESVRCPTCDSLVARKLRTTDTPTPWQVFDGGHAGPVVQMTDGPSFTVLRDELVDRIRAVLADAARPTPDPCPAGICRRPADHDGPHREHEFRNPEAGS